MEHDGDINKDFHHEAFLGTLVKEGKLNFDNMDGYRKLIEIFHKVDRSKDHLLDKEELQDWIHDRILEHYNQAKADSDEVFKKVDLDKDDIIKWYEYKATLVGMDPLKLKEAGVTCKYKALLASLNNQTLFANLKTNLTRKQCLTVWSFCCKTYSAELTY